MVAIEGNKIDLRELTSSEPQVPPKVTPNQVAPVSIEKPLRRRLRNPEAYVCDEDIFIAELGCSEVDPSAFTKAMVDMDKPKWIKALDSKMESMKQNDVWTLVKPPEGINTHRE